MNLGAESLTADDVASPSIAGSESIVVTPGDATGFVVTPVSAATAGTTQAFTVTAFDVFGNVSDVYTGTIVFSSSDFQAGLPAAYTFTAADAGVHTFNVTFRTAGAQTLNVADSVNLSLKSAQSGIAIAPAAAASLSYSALPVAVTAGAAVPVTITLRDAFGNIATGYRGTLAFGSADAQAALPANYTFTATDAGVHTFTVAFKTADDTTFSVQDTTNPGLSGSQVDIAVAAGAVTHFAVRGPSSSVKGTAFSLTVTALDAYGNIVAGYRGKVHLADSVSGFVLPADYTFTAGDAGVHTFSILLNTTGLQTLTIDDIATPTLLGTIADTVTSAAGGGGGGGAGGGCGPVVVEVAVGGGGGGGKGTYPDRPSRARPGPQSSRRPAGNPGINPGAPPAPLTIVFLRTVVSPMERFGRRGRDARRRSMGAVVPEADRWRFPVTCTRDYSC